MELKGDPPAIIERGGGGGLGMKEGGPLIDHKSGGCRPHTPTSEDCRRPRRAPRGGSGTGKPHSRRRAPRGALMRGGVPPTRIFLGDYPERCRL